MAVLAFLRRAFGAEPGGGPAPTDGVSASAVPAADDAPLPPDILARGLELGLRESGGRLVCEESPSSGDAASAGLYLRKEIGCIAGELRARVAVCQEGLDDELPGAPWSRPLGRQQVLDLIGLWAMQRHDDVTRAALAQRQRMLERRRSLTNSPPQGDPDPCLQLTRPPRLVRRVIRDRGPASWARLSGSDIPRTDSLASEQTASPPRRAA